MQLTCMAHAQASLYINYHKMRIRYLKADFFNSLYNLVRWQKLVKAGENVSE